MKTKLGGGSHDCPDCGAVVYGSSLCDCSLYGGSRLDRIVALRKELTILQAENEKLRKALEVIKEYAKNGEKNCPICHGHRMKAEEALTKQEDTGE